MAPTKASYNTVAAEHQELRRMVDELRRFSGEPRPEAEEAAATGWAADLSGRLGDLRSKLLAHFEAEQGELFPELKVSFPRITRAVRRLEREHRAMLRGIDEVLEAARLFSDGAAPTGFRLRRRTTLLLDELVDHEIRETALIEQVFTEDLGPGD